MKVCATKPHYFSGEKFKASRPLDYIYDPLFTFSGPKDYYKAAHESFQTSSEFSVQPIFDSMFSDMVRFPRATLVLRPSHQLPLNIDTSYRGRVKAICQERTITAEVTGTDRYKYFRRPVTEVKDGPPSTTRFPLLGLENVTQLGLMAPPTTAQKLCDRSARYSATQVRGTQTDYRESEAQTVPWTPPFTTKGANTPEVLYLDQLSWGKGLPPGRHEVDIVERLRRKRAWEAHLPPLDCEENIKIRYKLIAEMEKNDWEFREKELEAVHEERMRKSEQLLEQHNLMNRTRLTYRMEFLEDDINKRKERKLQMIRHEKERALRKLCMKEKGYDPKKYKMNVLDEHLHHTSELYAPMKRYGVNFKNRHEKLAQKQFIIDDRDICNFEYAIDYRPVFDFNKASQPKKQTELCVRETRWTMENLVNLHHDLQKLRKRQASKIDTFYAQIEQRSKPSVRPDAPQISLTKKQLTEESLYQAAIMIQRLIHSRSMQSLMEHKRNCWKELMEELRTSGSGPLKKSPIDKDKESAVLKTRVAGVLENVIGLNVGSSISQTLYLLATELLRFKNEGIAHDQALQAEGARWRREMPEEGRRQKEMRRREEHNLMFSQLLDVYQESINDLMEGLVAKARENEAKLQAYDYAKEVARLAELERLKPPEEEEEEPISADLLFEFIAPEGLRELARTCMLILKQKYMEARQCLVERGQAEPLPEESMVGSSEQLQVEERSTELYIAGLVEELLERRGTIDMEEKLSEEPYMEEKLSEEPSTEERLSGKPSVEERLSEEQSMEKRYCWEYRGERLYGEPSMEEKLSGEPSMEERLSGKPSVEERLSEEQSMEKRYCWEYRGERLYGEPSMEEKLSGEPSMEERLSGKPSMEERLSEEPSMEERLSEEPTTFVVSEPSTSNALEPAYASLERSSYIYSEVTTMEGADTTPAAVEAVVSSKFGLQGAPERITPEKKLLARVMRDMCYVAGSLLHTAAKILNKALHLANIPCEAFDEALRRTMLVINGAIEEVIHLIVPKKPEEKQLVSEELLLEASRIVDDILEKAKQRIAEMKESDLLKMASDSTEYQAKELVEDVIKEAQQKVLRLIVEDFLADLIQEAQNKVDIFTSE